ncbi:MAG: excalibur calcium-binding domain-containing protein [Vicinamibacterales bacterium]|nr:excalibur calcium-binding domain-containing protein [Vicinamibacterales bacterium]
MHRDHPAYPYMRDGDGDGIVCEAGGGGGSRQGTQTRQAPRSGGSTALQQYDDNGNGRITCAEARRHGIAPVRRGHPAYRYMNDRDNDGIVCE